ncbi:MAG: class A beta-lactamase-related serine hydrolase [Betaproteobacteria bacterium]|jgi:D-aminopeptidase|nr:class A beta-lactamase-related serine hydrolase [Betaproteobacteria bacterium]
MPKRKTTAPPQPADPATPQQGVLAALDAIFAPVDRSNAPGLVVGVAHQGRTLYCRGFGMSSIEHATANTPATRMRIGSATKHFTCLAVLLLAEEGLLDVDAPVTRYVPELSELLGAPTLRQLMNHTGGLRCYLDILVSAGGAALQPKGRALSVLAQQTGANFAPGDKQLYCNSGHHLMSKVVDRVAGIPFEDFLQQRIFQPLGMADTVCVPSDMQILPGMATQHVAQLQPGGGIGWRRGILPPEELRGEGSIVSTVGDMLRWLAHLRADDKTVGRPATWAQMTATPTLNNGQPTVYALGLFCHPYRGVDVVYHSGAVFGGLCQMLTVPAHGLDIIIMTNGALLNPTEASWHIINAVLAEHLRGPATLKRAGSDRFKHLLGTQYLGDSGLVFGFADVGGQLGISMNFSPPAPRLLDEGKQFRLLFEELAMGPFVLRVADLLADGKAPAVLPFSECGQPMRLKRLPTRAPATSKAGQPLLGRYRSADLDADAIIAFEGEKLTLRMHGTYGSRQAVLEAASAEVFRMTIQDEYLPGTAALVCERRDGAVTGFRFGTARSRGLHFVRQP